MKKGLKNYVITTCFFLGFGVAYIKIKRYEKAMKRT